MQYLPSFMQSAVFTGRVARQTNRFVRTAHDCETGLFQPTDLCYL